MSATDLDTLIVGSGPAARALARALPAAYRLATSTPPHGPTGRTGVESALTAWGIRATPDHDQRGAPDRPTPHVFLAGFAAACRSLGRRAESIALPGASLAAPERDGPLLASPTRTDPGARATAISRRGRHVVVETSTGEHLRARRTLLAAGGAESPRLLERAGLIEPRRARHPLALELAFVPRDGRAPPAFPGVFAISWHSIRGRALSVVPVATCAPAPWRLRATLHAPRAARGRDPDDLRALAEAVEMAWLLGTSAALAPHALLVAPNERDLRAGLREFVGEYAVAGAPACTLPLGEVVGPRGEVPGVSGLQVVDESVFPTLPEAGLADTAFALAPLLVLP